MKASNYMYKLSLIFAVLLVILPSTAAARWWNRGAECEEVNDRGYINVLTFNILFFAQEASVETRITRIATYLAGLGEPIDLIFPQAIVGGELALSAAPNSAKLLQQQLAVEGLDYNLRTAFEIGIPGLFFTGNSILNRCKIKFSIVKRLSRESEIEIFGRVIKLPRNVQMARIKVPGFGKLNAYNTHLCAGCSIDERDEQLGELFDFLDLIENFIPGTDPILLAGDFNIDIFKDKGQDDFGPEKEALYEDITDRGFVDAYAEVFGDPSLPGTLLGLCRNEDDGDVHCTVGITAFDELDPGNASRIDYVFRWGFGSATAAEVFFNPTVDNN